MLGQDNFLNKLNRFTLTTLPHSLLIIGEAGSGQEEVGAYIANKFGLETKDITDSISTELIQQLYLSSNQVIYTINVMNISEKEQNALLKVFEEPCPYIYLLLYGESTYNILETIINRSYMIQMDKYTKEFLEPLVKGNKELILNTCNTPGQIEIANHTDMEALYKLCQNMVDKMSGANFANALSITRKINFKDEYDKFDLTLFIRVLQKVLLETNSYKIYMELLNTSKFINYMNDKKSYFDHFIIKLWKLSRGIEC